MRYGYDSRDPYYATPAVSPRPVTEPQVRFLQDLCAKRLVPSDISDFAANLKVGLPLGVKTSDMIDRAKACGWKPKAVAPCPADKVSVLAEKGYYRLMGADGTYEIFNVCASRQNPARTIAKVLKKDGNRGHWNYISGMVYKLRAENRISLSEAAAFGHLNGFCLVCGRTLVDPKSVQNGIGPVCAKKFA